MVILVLSFCLLSGLLATWVCAFAENLHTNLGCDFWWPAWPLVKQSISTQIEGQSTVKSGGSRVTVGKHQKGGFFMNWWTPSLESRLLVWPLVEQKASDKIDF